MQDLADLFRANLSDKRTQITLAEELEVARPTSASSNCASATGSSGLEVCEALPPDAMVPSLVIQPLLENAIYHGIEPRPEGGMVTVNGELTMT